MGSIQSAVEKGSFPAHTNAALISLIPKKGKDKTECSNYRPISDGLHEGASSSGQHPTPNTCNS